MSVHEPQDAAGPPEGVEAYILDMLAQLAALAQANGLPRLARALRTAARDEGRDLAA